MQKEKEQYVEIGVNKMRSKRRGAPGRSALQGAGAAQSGFGEALA